MDCYKGRVIVKIIKNFEFVYARFRIKLAGLVKNPDQRSGRLPAVRLKVSFNRTAGFIGKDEGGY